MSNELAIPNEQFTVYHDDDWQPIADIFNTYKQKFESDLEHVEECLGLATQWLKFQTNPPEKPETTDLFFDLLSQSLKQYDFLPELRDNIPANINDIISTLRPIKYNYEHHYIPGQTDAIDATRRFIRACAILQDLHAHGVSTQTPEDYLKKLKDKIELVSSDFQTYEDEPEFLDGTAIDLAEVFCRGTDQIEDWLLQHVYNSFCTHNRLVPTVDVPSIKKSFNDVKSSLIVISSKLDETKSAANNAAEQAAQANAAANTTNTTANLTREEVQAGNTANKNGIAAIMTNQQNLHDDFRDLNEVYSASAAEAPILDPNKKTKTNISPEEAAGIMYDYLEKHNGLQYAKCAKTIRRWLNAGKAPVINLDFPPSALASQQSFEFWCAKYKWKCDHYKRAKNKKTSRSSYVRVHPKTGSLVVD